MLNISNMLQSMCLIVTIPHWQAKQLARQCLQCWKPKKRLGKRADVERAFVCAPRSRHFSITSCKFKSDGHWLDCTFYDEDTQTEESEQRKEDRGPCWRNFSLPSWRDWAPPALNLERNPERNPPPRMQPVDSSISMKMSESAAATARTKTKSKAAPTSFPPIIAVLYEVRSVRLVFIVFRHKGSGLWSCVMGAN